MKSKKIIVTIVVLAALLLAAVCWKAYQNEQNADMENYCYAINDLLKDLDFSFARISDGSIQLYDHTDSIIEEIPFGGYDKHLKILSIRKEGNAIFFVLGGSVDDETGIMFVNGDYNNILNGINSIERIGGNYYRYETAQ